MPAIKHTDFWAMISEIKAHCKAANVHVLLMDDAETLKLGFMTDCSAFEPEFRMWEIRTSDVTRTLNDPATPGITRRNFRLVAERLKLEHELAEFVAGSKG